jgi:hypothetical protein
MTRHRHGGRASIRAADLWGEGDHKSVRVAEKIHTSQSGCRQVWMHSPCVDKASPVVGPFLTVQVANSYLRRCLQVR